MDHRLNKVGMKHVNASRVPKCLNRLQKRGRIEVTKEILDNVGSTLHASNAPTTGDETLLYKYDVETVQKN